MLESNFSTVDWVIVAVYLAAIVGLGLYVNRYVQNMADFVVAGRSLKSLLAIATMIGSELGLVTVMYSAQKGVTGGFASFHIGLIAGAMTLMVGLTGVIVVPLRRLGVMTIPEYYEKRYSRGVRILGGLILAAAGILNMGLFLKAGALFVTGLTGMQDPFAVNIVMTVLIVLVLIYTTLGGMISVVITDYLQFVLLSIGLLVTCALAVNEIGWSTIVETVRTMKGEAGFDPFHEEGFGYDYIGWQVVLAFSSCAVWQTAVLRACSAESLQVVKRLYTWSSIGFLIRFMLPQFLGICAVTYLWLDPAAHSVFFLESGEADPETTLLAMPVFLGQVLPVGLVGVIGAGMLAAFMSTHDTYLLCWATVLTEDVVNPLYNGRLSVRARLLLTRVLIVVIAVFLLGWSLWYDLGQDLWDYMAVTGGIYFAGALPLLIAGIYSRWASPVGAYLSLLAGLCMVFGLTSDLAISKPLLSLLVVLMSFAALLLGSFLFPAGRRKI